MEKTPTEIFEIEVDCWLFGLDRFSEPIYPKLIHGVIREMGPLFHATIENGHVFDIFVIARKVNSIFSDILSERQCVFAILANLPMIFDLPDEKRPTLYQIVWQAEREYGGVLAQMRELWEREASEKGIVPTSY